MAEWRIICGDVETVLLEYPATHFDACLCDPPYGYSFLGRAWDYQVPSVSLWAEVLRVLKRDMELMLRALDKPTIPYSYFEELSTVAKSPA